MSVIVIKSLILFIGSIKKTQSAIRSLLTKEHFIFLTIKKIFSQTLFIVDTSATFSSSKLAVIWELNIYMTFHNHFESLKTTKMKITLLAVSQSFIHVIVVEFFDALAKNKIHNKNMKMKIFVAFAFHWTRQNGCDMKVIKFITSQPILTKQ